MKLSAQWIRDFVDLTVDNDRLAEALTNVGVSVEGISGSGADTVFDMEIGTNRPDAMNHYGVAREAAAIYDLPLKAISVDSSTAANANHGNATAGNRTAKALAAQALVGKSTPGQPKAAEGTAGKRTRREGHAGRGTASAVPLSSAKNPALAPDVSFPITVEEPQLCPRFSARLIRNTKIKPSPQKVAHRLQLLDQRPISNAVDATNYVLWEIGKPTHVFDADLLEGDQIIVRKARAGETLKTLDGVERTLTNEDLVVCDAKKPVGLAGVMGGYDTMITEKTRNIVIESAWWDPGIVRKMSRRHGLHTDASHRFERGADFESTLLSCDLVAQMILDSGGGELIGDTIDVVSRPLDLAPVLLRISEVHRILGGQLDAGQVYRLLKRLGFILIPEGQQNAEFRVTIPSWRLDVEREIDVIEEIARLHGYDKFESTLPAYSGAVIQLPHAKVDRTLRTRALALGYNEAVSLTFISHQDAEKFATVASTDKVLELENPLSEEASVMRTSLAPGMLNMLAWNLNRDVADARLFEIGGTYALSGEERVEPRRACLGATLSAIREVSPAAATLDVSKGPNAMAVEAFRGFKGDVENLLAAFAGDVSYDRETAEYFHPGRSARALIHRTVVAQFGQIHPDIASARKLRQDVFLAEIDLEHLYQVGLRPVRFEPLPKYPAVERDFSFVFSDDVTFEQIQRAVDSTAIPSLRDFRPLEIFRGGSIPSDRYSVLLRAKFQSAERTLREDEVAQCSAKIVSALNSLGGQQRV